MKKKIRPSGEIFLDLEVLIDELMIDHDWQWGDLIYFIYGHLMIHHQNNREKYVDDGSHPVLEYKHKGE